MATTIPLPLIPAHLVKYIASFHPDKTQTNVSDYAEYVLSIFRAFTPDNEIDNYKKEVQERLSDMVYYNVLGDYYQDWFLSTLVLSPEDVMDIYEVTFINHYSQTYGCNKIPTIVYGLDDTMFDAFVGITALIENHTTLYEDERIMGGSDYCYYLHMTQLSIISLLERCLLGKKNDLLTFITGYMNVPPILAFYLYVKHNHASYKTEENSLAKDEMLLNLFLENGFEKELLALAIGGVFNNEFIYTKKYSESQTIERHMVMPNPAVVKRIMDEFPGICNEPIPFYMKPQIEVDDDEIYGEEGPDEILPLEYWHQYKNTFEERIFVDRSNDVYCMQTITIPKNESIGVLLAQ
jgi:hypothetical protein